MIRYHGGPVTPNSAAIQLWQGRHAMISYSEPRQIGLAAEMSQSFALDNGAYTAWAQGKTFDMDGYKAWVDEWRYHPGFDWCLIPDVIDGAEDANKALMDEWFAEPSMSVPVWHLHESLDWLQELMCSKFPRIALGSSGEWSSPGTEEWWQRMIRVMRVCCDEQGRPKRKLHGLRMLNPVICVHLPLSSADSCGVARNLGQDERWERGYTAGLSKNVRAQVLADRFERHATASRWTGRPQQENLFLLG